MVETKPILFGAPYSVYVRICRMALTAKGVDYELVPVDIFADGGPGDAYAGRHPFGKIPAFEHGDVRLYEANSIITYVDEAFDGPALTFDTAIDNARMRQLISIADNYVYPVLVWKCSVPSLEGGTGPEEEDWPRGGQRAGCH